MKLKVGDVLYSDNLRRGDIDKIPIIRVTKTQAVGQLRNLTIKFPIEYNSDTYPIGEHRYIGICYIETPELIQKLRRQELLKGCKSIIYDKLSIEQLEAISEIANKERLR